MMVTKILVSKNLNCFIMWQKATLTCFKNSNLSVTTSVKWSLHWLFQDEGIIPLLSPITGTLWWYLTHCLFHLLTAPTSSLQMTSTEPHSVWWENVLSLRHSEVMIVRTTVLDRDVYKEINLIIPRNGTTLSSRSITWTKISFLNFVSTP